ncbi:site-specific integrase [Streptomyces halstedii]|uniref:site-specific integrase n=1 Tax=Streptomyces halstedii TaxID=1944 RepID=UPI0036BC799A
MDYFFTSRDRVRRSYEAPIGVDLNAVQYVESVRALTDGTPFFLGSDMRPLEPHCSFFFEMAKTLKASSLQDYAYDFLALDDFLAALDPPSDVLAATEDDLLAYRRYCTEHREVPMAPATWKRHRTTINSFYDWAVQAKLLEGRPYFRKANGRDVLSWGSTSALDVRHQTFDQWSFLDRVGLRGLLPDGSADGSFRGAYSLRNSGGGNLAITTGLRLREFRSLLDIEVGPPRRDGTAGEIELQAIAKFGLPRTVEVQDATLRELDWYRRTERAATVRKAAKNLTRNRDELFVVHDIDLRLMKVQGRQYGRRKTWTIKAMPAEVRRIAVIEGTHGLEPMALFVGRGGLMISAQRWEQVFNDAHARALRIIAEYNLPLEMPRRIRIHDMRHTFAVYMLELLTQLQREKDAEEYTRSGRVASYAADHIARNPFLTVMGLLGHRSPGSTMRYLTYRRSTNLLVAQAVAQWSGQDSTYAQLAGQHAERWS